MNIETYLTSIMNNQVAILKRFEQLEAKLDAVLNFVPNVNTDNSKKVSATENKTDVFQETSKSSVDKTYSLEDIFDTNGKLKSEILKPLFVYVDLSDSQLELFKFVNDLILHMLMMPKGSKLNIEKDFIPRWLDSNQIIETPGIGFAWLGGDKMRTFTNICQALNDFNVTDLLNRSYSVPEAPGSCIRNLVYALQYKNISPALTVFKLLVTNPYFYQTRYV